MKLTKTQLREIIKEEIQKMNESISTLGLSGIKGFAKKHNLSIRSKKSGGRVPYVYLTKNGKEYGPFDPTITTEKSLLKKLEKL